VAKVGGVEPALGGPSAVPVALVHWPTEAAVRDRLAADGLPRLLLVNADAVPPDDFDDLEDWIRLPADERDVSVRVRALSERARRIVTPPVLLDGWLLRFGGREAALSESEAAVVAHLLGHWGQLVPRDDLAGRLGQGRGGRAAGLDDVVYRLRRRLRPLGLEIHAARARGLMLHLAAHTGAQDHEA
jgi:DNA-binding winged helix-turn-helix (wHTH) protein